jgi:arabinoxylan arabinofuranohydrolase
LKAAIRFLLAVGGAGLFLAGTARATNPLILDQFTADPTARVFDGRIYLYPSHDILAVPGKGRPGWFCMEDYHVFSSANLTDWKDHGVILRQTDVAWVDPTSYSLWAPDCVCRNGKYYLYFPARAREGGFRIGVAVADRPAGPFTPETKPIAGVHGIDPCVFIDRDGRAYLFYSERRIFVARLKANLVELDGPPTVVDHLPATGLLEGPFVFERNGTYYLTYPHAAHKTERIEYATSRHPLGPYQPAGVIMDESASGCWTNQPSIVEHQGQWYLFYHDQDLSPNFDKARSVRADRLFFNDDGSIKKVVPTLRGVGIVAAKSRIQIDRYSAISRAGVSVSFLNPAEPREGWKLSLAGNTSWVRFDDVDFGQGGLQRAEVRAIAPAGGAIDLRLDKTDGPVLGRATFGRLAEWTVVSASVRDMPAGVHALVVTQAGSQPVELDWVRFE